MSNRTRHSPRSEMEWDKTSALRLLTEFRKRELLWRPKDFYYYNSTKKEDAWGEISEIMNVSVEELKKKMDSLKGSYRRERSRVKRKMRTGKGRMEIYVSNWFAYDSMRFFEERDGPRKTIYNAGEEVEEHDETAMMSSESNDKEGSFLLL